MSEELWNLRRLVEAGSGVVNEGGDWSMRRHGLKYDWWIRKSGEGGGRGCRERRRRDLNLPGALGLGSPPITISALWERLCL